MSEIKFNIGQDVVYPSQGVGRITEIFEKEFRGVSQLYYKMYIFKYTLYVNILYDTILCI